MKNCYGVIRVNDEVTGFDYLIKVNGDWTVLSKEFRVDHREAKKETKPSYNVMTGGRAPTHEELNAIALRVVQLSEELDYSMVK